MIRAAIALMLAVTLSAQQKTEPCTGNCVPPPTWRSEKSLPPLDAPLRFGAVVGHQWAWIRAGDPSRPCTPAEAAATTTTECAAKVGDVLLVSPMFRFPKAPRVTGLMSAAEIVWYGAYHLERHKQICIGGMVDRATGKSIDGTYPYDPRTMRCNGVAYSEPYSTFVAVRMNEIEVFSPGGKISHLPDRCVAVIYEGGSRAFAESEQRIDRTWIVLPLYFSRTMTFSVRATSYANRNCGALSDLRIGETILPPVTIALLPTTTREALP